MNVTLLSVSHSLESETRGPVSCSQSPLLKKHKEDMRSHHFLLYYNCRYIFLQCYESSQCHRIMSLEWLVLYILTTFFKVKWGLKKWLSGCSSKEPSSNTSTYMVTSNHLSLQGIGDLCIGTTCMPCTDFYVCMQNTHSHDKKYF